jgi:hypothetical protein
VTSSRQIIARVRLQQLVSAQGAALVALATPDGQMCCPSFHTILGCDHADYDLLNHGDPAAWAYGPHGEVSCKPGFSGAMPGDRAVAAGYPWPAGR